MRLTQVRNRIQEHAGIRMTRLVKECPLVCQFNQATQIHHTNPITDVVDDGEVVRDKQIG